MIERDTSYFIALMSLSLLASCTSDRPEGGQTNSPQERVAEQANGSVGNPRHVSSVEDLNSLLSGKQFRRVATSHRPGSLEQFFANGSWKLHTAQIDLEVTTGKWSVSSDQTGARVCIDRGYMTGSERYYGELDCRWVTVFESGRHVSVTDIDGRYTNLYLVEDIQIQGW